MGLSRYLTHMRELRSASDERVLPNSITDSIVVKRARAPTLLPEPTLPSGRVTCQQLMGGWWLICSTNTCMPAKFAWKVSPNRGLKGFRVLVCRLRPPTTNATSNFILLGKEEAAANGRKVVCCPGSAGQPGTCTVNQQHAEPLLS